MFSKYFCMLVELTEVEKISLKNLNIFNLCFETPVWNVRKRCFELNNVCVSSPSETYFDIFLLPEKWRLLVVVDFCLGQQVTQKITFIATVICSACHGSVCEFALATYLPRPLGNPLDGVITHLVSKEELPCPVFPSPPHKSYSAIWVP